MNDNISDKDKNDWQAFISSKEKLKNKDFNSDLKVLQKTKYIDLHGYTLEEANEQI